MQLIEGQLAERLKLINAAGEQLSQGRLWTVHTETLLQQPQLLGREDGWIRPLIQRIDLIDRFRNRCRRLGDRWRKTKSQAQDKGSAALQMVTHELEAGLCSNQHRN